MIKYVAKTVLITGAAKRIGREIALSLAKKGSSIILHFNSSEKEATETVNQIQSIIDEKQNDAFVMKVQADLSDISAIDNMLNKIPQVDILINNASNFYKTEFKEITVEEWNNVLHVNLRAPFILTQFMAKQALKEGCVINIADMAGVHAWPNFVHHGASKAALIHLTKSSAVCLAPEIRVNTIIPGMILPPSGMTQDKWIEMSNNIALKRSGTPEAIVKTVKYIIENDFITGAEIRVDGGEFLTGHANNKQVK